MSKRRLSLKYDAKPHGYGHSHDSIAGLQVIQYRSYQRDMHIYHLRTHLLPLQAFRNALQSQEEYREKLTSYDPLRYFDIIPGDEIPPGCTEAVYLPGVLRGYGSALALRAGGDLDSEAVEWYVFSGSIEESFLSQVVCTKSSWSLQLNTSSSNSWKAFDLVGYAEKGLKTRTVRGANREHKGWHDALCASKPTRKNVKSTWKKFGDELRANEERKPREKTVDPEEQEYDESGDVGVRDGSKQPPQPPQKPVTRRTEG